MEAGIGQPLVYWDRCPAWCNVVDSTVLVEEIFPLELTWVLTSHPKNPFGWEYKPRSSVCTHAFHRADTEDPDTHVLDGWMLAAKTPSKHPSIKTECGYLYGWNRKGSHTQISDRKLLTQRYSWGRRGRTPEQNDPVMTLKKKKALSFGPCCGTPTRLFSFFWFSQLLLWSSPLLSSLTLSMSSSSSTSSVWHFSTLMPWLWPSSSCSVSSCHHRIHHHRHLHHQYQNHHTIIIMFISSSTPSNHYHAVIIITLIFSFISICPRWSSSSSFSSPSSSVALSCTIPDCVALQEGCTTTLHALAVNAQGRERNSPLDSPAMGRREVPPPVPPRSLSPAPSPSTSPKPPRWVHTCL